MYSAMHQFNGDPFEGGGLQNPNSLIFPFLNFLFAFCFLNYRFYLPLYLKSVGVNETGIGGLMSLFPLTSFILIFPLGMLADRVNARRVISVGAIGAIFFGLLMPTVETSGAMAAVMIFGGASSSLYFVGINALFFKHVEEKNRGIRTALFFAGASLGQGTGTLLGGYLIDRVGPEAIFMQGVVSAAAMLAAGLLAPSAPMFKINFSDYLKDLRKPAALIVVAVTFVIQTHVGVEFVSYTLFMERAVGLSGSEIGLIFIIVSSWMIFWGLVAGRYYDGSRKPVMMLGLAVLWSGIFQYLTVYANDFTSMAFLRLAHTFGDGFFNVIIMVLVGITFPRGRVGGNFGFIIMVNTMAIFIANNVSGLLMQGDRYGLPFQVSGVVMVLAGLLMLLSRKPILRALNIE